MAELKLVGLCGALRKGSTNRLLMIEAARLFGTCDFVEADLRFPLFDADLQEAEGIPPVVQATTELIAAADAVVIATPEYNKALPGVLKNALDWISRVPGAALRDKPVAIMSAAGGRAGGERSQFSLRLCLVPFRPQLIAGPEVMVADSGNAFDAEGRLTNERTAAGLSELMGHLRRAAQ